MTGLLALGYLAAAAATVLAWVAARARPIHRPIAALLTFGLTADLIRRALRVLVLGPAYSALNGAPAMGWLRFPAHLDQALFLGWPAGLAAAALWTYLGQRPWPMAIGYALVEIGLIAMYPTGRGDLVRKAYLGIQLACLTVAVGALLHWALFRKNAPSVTHWIVALVITSEMVSVAAGPWRLGFFLKWDLAQIVYTMLYSMLILIQWGWLWVIRRSPSR